ncbi:MAG: TolB-like 6-bladed beta-propeller domain-containing protein [Prevotellaceae bacterium]|jgi:hypothetical protein|nr:TolB-like 6-bladed beta-propeller domain-containing protein [Prevotellaceae bacterium]
MKEKYYIVVLIIIIVLYSCQVSRNHVSDTVVLSQTTKTDAKRLMVDTIDLSGYSSSDDFIYARFFLVYQDSVLIVVNNKYEEVCFLEFYNMKNREMLKKMYRLGDGPNELLSANVDISGNLLFVNDFIKGQVAFVNIDSVLINPDYHCLPIQHAYKGSPTAVPYKDSLLLLENPNHFIDKGLRINQDVPRFLVASRNKTAISTAPLSYKYYTRNVAVDGRIITNYEKDRIFYADFHKPLLEIYDSNLILIKSIAGPDVLPIEYAIRDNSLSFKGRVPYAYLRYCMDNEAVYLIYIGDFISVSRDAEELPAWIFKFDWEGTFMESYTTGKYIVSLTLSNEADTFYATIREKGNEPHLVKLSYRAE